MAAVLRAAVEDVDDAAARTRALAYVTSTDRLWPYSFENLCEALNMDANRVRSVLAGSAVEDADGSIQITS